MTASQFILDPLRGKISLWRVTWLYCLVPGAILQMVGELIVGAGDTAMRAVGLLALLYATYVAVATSRCAGNVRGHGLVTMFGSAYWSLW